MSTYCIIITSTNQNNAKEIASKLIAEKLAACVQMFPIESVYEWDNSICYDKEILLIIKSQDKLYNEIESRIKQLHEYDIPEILKLDVASGYKGYLEWILKVTK